METIKTTCGRCGGSGRVPHWHIADGVCFACNGSGVIYTKDLNCDLDTFLYSGRPSSIPSHVEVVMIKPTPRVGGGTFISFKDSKNRIVFWNQKAGANWYFAVPAPLDKLIRSHFDTSTPRKNFHIG